MFRRRQAQRRQAGPLAEAADWMEEIVARHPGAEVVGAMVIAEVRLDGEEGTALVYAGDEREQTPGSKIEGLVGGVARTLTAARLAAALRSGPETRLDPE